MIIRTRKLSDKTIVGLLRWLLNKFENSNAVIAYGGGISTRVSNEEELRTLPNKGTERIIEKFTFNPTDSTLTDVVTFARGVQTTSQPNINADPVSKFVYREESAFFDELALLGRPNNQTYKALDDDLKISVVRELGKLAAPVGEIDPVESGNFARVLDANLSELQRVTTDFLERSATERQRDEALFRKRMAELEKSYVQKQQELDRHKADLEKKREELNDREPQHERRRLRETLTRDLHQFVKEPPARAVQREWISNAAYIAIGFLFVAVSAILTLNYSQLNATDLAFQWSTIAKSTGAGIAGAAFMWAGLAGLKHTASSAREFEQQVQRYAFDMDRASWVVETILQMSATEKAQVPDEWLQAVCRDLFSSGGKKSDDARSLESFAALFDATAKARIGTSGVEFEIDRKGAKRLAHEG